MEGYLGEFSVDDHDFHKYSPADWAVKYLSHYFFIGGLHHKQWLLDQIARILLGTPVIVTEARWANGEKEYRFITGEPSAAYIEWCGDSYDDEETKGIAP